MNHIKAFFKEKGLYLFCLALVFAATAAGILALRSVVNNMSELTQLRKDVVGGQHMDPARHHRKQPGHRRAGTDCRALGHAVCFLLVVWCAVGICCRIRRTRRHCRAVGAACRLLGYLAGGAGDGVQW